jgi:excisionase family DNA binding protein
MLPMTNKKETTRVEARYTVQEVAQLKLLGLAQRSIRQLIKDGKLRVQRIKTEGMKKARVFIPESAIKEYLEKYTQEVAD